jgi:non-canonical purine NTP pyrophosphatase (RdgB/HAM1 family)
MTKRINFVTTNPYKFEVAKKYFEQLPSDKYELIQYDIETHEVQDESEAEIARQSALWVSKELGELAVASDVGFHINSLGGFPGPYVKYVNQWLHPSDVLNMLQSHEDRSAYFIDVLALASPDGNTHIFVVKTPGAIVEAAEVPDTKWTMDAVFVPDGHAKTLATMDEAEKDAVWSDEAWEQLTNYLERNN